MNTIPLSIPELINLINNENDTDIIHKGNAIIALSLGWSQIISKTNVFHPTSICWTDPSKSIFQNQPPNYLYNINDALKIIPKNLSIKHIQGNQHQYPGNWLTIIADNDDIDNPLTNVFSNSTPTHPTSPTLEISIILAALNAIHYLNSIS